MSALADKILADIDARLREMILGTRTDGAHCAVSSGSALRARDIEKAMKKLEALPNPIVGFVCRPDAVARIRRVAEEEAHTIFGPVAVYEKEGQTEMCLAFYDLKELHRYLSPNVPHQP